MRYMPVICRINAVRKGLASPTGTQGLEAAGNVHATAVHACQCEL